MITFVNYIEFILKNRKKSEKKSENYIIITANTNIRYSCRKNPKFGIITVEINICCSYITK
jgi:UDP-N-acetyl-D-mannosaminuronic acid transferase (WecB/TagA/CpsF family)